jgi:hypothetical protein
MQGSKQSSLPCVPAATIYIYTRIEYMCIDKAARPCHDAVIDATLSERTQAMVPPDARTVDRTVIVAAGLATHLSAF